MSALPVTCGPVQAGPGFPSPRLCPQRAAPRFGSCPAPRGSHHSQYLLGQGWAETWGETPWEKRAQRKAHLILLLKQLEASDTCAGLPPRLAAGQHGGGGLCRKGGCPRPPWTCSRSAPMQEPVGIWDQLRSFCHQPPGEVPQPVNLLLPWGSIQQARWEGDRDRTTSTRAHIVSPRFSKAAGEDVCRIHLQTSQAQPSSQSSGAAQAPAHIAPCSQVRFLPQSIHAPSQINTSLQELKGLGVQGVFMGKPQPITSGSGGGGEPGSRV